MDPVKDILEKDLMANEGLIHVITIMTCIIMNTKPKELQKMFHGEDDTEVTIKIPLKFKKFSEKIFEEARDIHCRERLNSKEIPTKILDEIFAHWQNAFWTSVINEGIMQVCKYALDPQMAETWEKINESSAALKQTIMDLKG